MIGLAAGSDGPDSGPFSLMLCIRSSSSSWQTASARGAWASSPPAPLPVPTRRSRAWTGRSSATSPPEASAPASRRTSPWGRPDPPPPPLPHTHIMPTGLAWLGTASGKLFCPGYATAALALHDHPSFTASGHLCEDAWGCYSCTRNPVTTIYSGSSCSVSHQHAMTCECADSSDVTAKPCLCCIMQFPPSMD